MHLVNGDGDGRLEVDRSASNGSVSDPTGAEHRVDADDAVVARVRKQDPITVVDGDTHRCVELVHTGAETADACHVCARHIVVSEQPIVGRVGDIDVERRIDAQAADTGYACVEAEVIKPIHQVDPVNE